MMRVIETRLTFDHGGQAGMTCNYPLGFFNTVLSVGHRVEIDRGQYPIVIELDYRPGGWAIITDVTGQPMTKVRLPEVVEPDFREYRFFFHGKLYILEFRIDSISE